MAKTQKATRTRKPKAVANKTEEKSGPVTASVITAEENDAAEALMSKSVQLRFVGYKNREVPRIPPAVTLIMPDKKGREQDEAKVAVTSGKTLVVRRDEYRGFTKREAEWLGSHAALKFEEA